MKKITLLYLLAIVSIFTACKKGDEPEPIKTGTSNADKNQILTSNEWRLDDAIVHMKYNYSMMGYDYKMDTTYSAFSHSQPCEKAVSYFFRPTGKFEYIKDANYCGQPFEEKQYDWVSKDNYAKLLITGENAGGILYSNGTSSSISDTLTMNVLELTQTQLKTNYQLPLDEMYAKAGLNKELMESLGISITGSMDVTYIFKKK